MLFQLPLTTAALLALGNLVLATSPVLSSSFLIRALQSSSLERRQNEQYFTDFANEDEAKCWEQTECDTLPMVAEAADKCTAMFAEKGEDSGEAYEEKFRKCLCEDKAYQQNRRE